MKNLITLIIGLLVVRCGKQEKAATDESRKLTAEEEKIVGTYELKERGETVKFFFLANGILEITVDGKKSEEDAKWKIANGEIHRIDKDGAIDVITINKDGSITWIGFELDGKRTVFPKENQSTFHKIK